MNAWILIVIIASLLGSALVGGIFFAFSSFVMKALKRIPSPEGIRTMQSINVVVINPAFLGLFMGTALLSLTLIATVILGYSTHSFEALPHWFMIGAIHYFVGTFLVTLAGNVPLNNRLAHANADNAQSLWNTYLKNWTLYNHVRATSATIAALCFTMGLLQL
ncbi:anthrone oxygenase family protein [Pelagicoccus sp. SDUM812002]|uniref:anthrone oxygenase family protein n=1 Tax=Pelagicoccus sp. SDUM812002 TaxID=3041266 RepID=UPI00280E7CF7|nr:anthrone oxygenase family protein [Pelagicoccus sp. SDUM812002]MDQ8185272.1 DUF1772 domain-containing protein [Pelagicoccus sp. SDUM812002]